MKEIPFKQSKNYGCGHYALANLFNDKEILKDIIPGAGSYDHHLNQTLLNRNKGYFLDPIFILNPGVKCLPEKLADDQAFDIEFDGPGAQFTKRRYCLPFLCVIKRSLRLHFVIVILEFQQNHIYLVDSNNRHVVKMKLEHFVMDYYITGLYHFNVESNIQTTDNRDEPQGAVLWEKSKLSHLI